MLGAKCRALATLVVLASSLVGCGYKGPLTQTLPAEDNQQAQPQTEETTSQVDSEGS